MTDLREKLADVAEVAIDNVHDVDVTLRDYAEAAAQAIIAALPDMVVPLVWKGTHLAYCTLPFCQYQVREAEDGFYVQADGYKSECIASKLVSSEAAKAAAQAHYVATILAAFGVQGGEA